MSDSQNIFTIAEVLHYTGHLYSIADIKKTVNSRLLTKKANYTTYAFEKKYSAAFNIFFDLTQEFDNLLTTCVVATELPFMYFGIKANLFLYSTEKKFVSPHPDIQKVKLPFSAPIFAPLFKNNIFYVPMFSKRIAALPFEKAHDYLIGIFMLHCKEPLNSEEQIFWEKYANRVGAQLYNQSFADKNKKHLEFIHNIIHDIDHNIISKLFYFKILLKELEHKLEGSSHFYERLKSIEQSHNAEDLSSLVQDFATANIDIFKTYQQSYQHFKHTSIFLESLLRKAHFDEGKYILHTTQFNFDTRIILPLLDHYHYQFAERNITVVTQLQLHNAQNPQKSILVEGDYGLLAQVIDNLFSNAFKYTRPNKKNKKILRITTKPLYNSKKELKKIQITVCTTGNPVPEDEIEHLFSADFRSSNKEHEQGTGRGLFFIKEIIDEHGGKYAYSYKNEYNCFSLILPISVPAGMNKTV